MAAEVNIIVNSEFAQASKDLEQFEAVSKRVAKEVEEFQKSFDSNEVDEFIDRNKRAAAAVRATDGSLKGAIAEQKNLRKEIQSLIRSGLDPQSLAIEKLRDRYNELDDQIQKTKQEQKRFQEEQKKRNQNNEKYNDNLKTTIKRLAAVALGFISIQAASAFLKTSVGDFEKYSKGIANVNTLIPITAEEFENLDNSITGLSKQFAIQKTELSAGVYQALSAGAENLGESLDIVKQSSVLAKGALIENADAVDIVTTALNAYGPEVQNAAQITDDYFTIIKQGKINGEQLSEQIGKSISLFAAAKIPLEELGAGIATLTKVGVPAAEATTQLNGIINAFLKPTEDLTKAINEYGYASGSALLESKGLGGALEFLQSASGGSLEEMAALVPEIRGLRGALAAGKNDGIEYNKILKEFESNSGAATEALERQTSGFASEAFQLEQARVRFENFRIEVGGKVLPLLVDFIDMVEKSIPVLAGLTAGIVVFLAATKGAVLIEGLTVAFKGLTVAIASNPIGAIAAVITAVLIPAIIFLIKNWDRVVVVITTTLAKLKKEFELVGELIKNKWIVSFNSIKIAVLELAGTILDKALGAVNDFLDLAGKLPFVGDKFKDLQSNVNGFAAEIEQARLEAVAASNEAIKNSDLEKIAAIERANAAIAAIEKESSERMAALQEQKEEADKFNSESIAATEETEKEKTKVVLDGLEERLSALNNKEAQLQLENLSTFKKFLQARMEQEEIQGGERIQFLRNELARIERLDNLSLKERASANKAVTDLISEYQVKKAEETVKKTADEWSSGVDNIISIFESGFSAIGNAAEGDFSGFLKNAGKILQQIGQATGDAVAGIAGTIISAFAGVVNFLKDITGGNARRIAETVKAVSLQTQGLILEQTKERIDAEYEYEVAQIKAIGERQLSYVRDEIDWIESINQKKIDYYDSELKRMDDLQAARDVEYNNQITQIGEIENAKIEAFISTLSIEEQEALRSAGVIEETTLQRIDRELKAAIKAGDEEKANLLRNEREIEKVRSEASEEAERAARRKAAYDAFAAEERQRTAEKEARIAEQAARAKEREEQRLAGIKSENDSALQEAEKRYRNQVAQWEYDKAVYDKETKIASAEAARAQALAELPWYTSRANRNSVANAYDSLISQIQAVRIPAAPRFAQGGSFLTSGPQTITVGDNIGGVERVSVEPVSSSGANVDSSIRPGRPLVLRIGNRDFEAWLEEEFDNQRIRVNPGAIGA